MSCERREPTVFLHAHAELQGLGRLLTQLHLDHCPGCRARWARWVLERDELRSSLAPLSLLDDDPSTIRDAVCAEVRAMPRWPASGEAVVAGRRGRRPAWLIAAAAMAALLSVAWAARVWAPALLPRGPHAQNQATSECLGCHTKLPEGHPRGLLTPTVTLPPEIAPPGVTAPLRGSGNASPAGEQHRERRPAPALPPSHPPIR